MKLLIISLLFSFNSANSKNHNAFITVFEQSEGTETATYFQVIDYYQTLAAKFSQISIQKMGSTDSGQPLHIVIYNPNGQQSFKDIHKTKSVLLINNGIHPGESDGIDASMMLFRDLAIGKVATPKNTVLVTIPIYNIGGSLNRNSHSRTNQNGPKEYGFRGNARNFDLNRDFIKNDTKNAQSFAQIFHHIQPDVFIDNHVSNGADYQYILTHLFTQHNKLGGDLGSYVNQSMRPNLEKKLKQKNWDITPYVNVFNRVPETGFKQFMDYPRYSTGYTTLFNTIGMMVETHMLKPYKQRVEGTYQLMVSMIEIMDTDSIKIKALRKDYFKNIYAQEKYPLDWEVDQDKSTTLDFKGYQGTIIESKVTNGQRLKYNRNKPFTKQTKYQNHFKPTVQITIPEAYIVPQGWHEIIDLLILNNVEMHEMKSDKVYNVESYEIIAFETKKAPYEGHYLHTKTQVNKVQSTHTFKKGDFLINLNQPAIRYLIETLEPQAPDSFFNWNYFDTILQQKEGFSPYVFEELAEEILAKNPKLAEEFKQQLKDTPELNDNWYAQLDWIHKKSKYYETSHNKYPIYRLPK